MQKLLRLCLWQAIIIGILTAHFPVNAEEERGIRMRGSKSSDVFPYDRYGPITVKDTLWSIATRLRPDSRLSVYQVMQALYQENPQAFVDSNINHLVEGQSLKIPSFNTMMAINTNSAKKKSANDVKAWKNAQPKSIKKIVAKEASIQKKDLETVKIEINDQLQNIDGQQQKRLATIQNDISDSIDSLQAILKENDNLRLRLNSFNDKLGVMQDEVAKGKEIKLQMDDMIKLQQALLAKAEAREKQLLLDKQQAELTEQEITSSLWFKIVIGTMPAILILSLLFFLFKRRKQASDEDFFNDLENKKQSPTTKQDKPAKELSLDNGLSLDDAKVTNTVKQDLLDSIVQSNSDREIDEQNVVDKLTAEYVTPLLTVDFSDIMGKESEAELPAETLANDTSDTSDEPVNTQVYGSFTEAKLSQLLTDTDDLDDESLAEDDELGAIKELDNVDFDELLANIEEESVTVSIDYDEFELPITYIDDDIGANIRDDIGDDLIGDSLYKESIAGPEDVEKTVDNYVSVDDLLSESLDDTEIVEPYEKSNIDVGLDQFSQNESGVDVDEDGSMSSQLYLAKMYIEMSDEENAQVILQDVILKGDLIQKAEAQKLLDSL